MLHSYITKKGVQPKTTATNSLRAILIVLGIAFVLLVIGALVVVALIPLYLPNRSVPASQSNEPFQYEFSFPLEQDLGIPDGPLDSNSLAILEAYLKSVAATTDSNVLAQGEIKLVAANLTTTNVTTSREHQVGNSTTNSNRSKRAVFRLIVVTIIFVSTNFAGTTITIFNILAVAFQNVVIPVAITVEIITIINTTTTVLTTTSQLLTTTSIILTTTTAITTTTAACVDTVGFVYTSTETGSTKTCATYENYGDCSNRNIAGTITGDEATQARANCCACGKTT